MLIELGVKNLAVIKSIDIEFSSKLNILTGETGAGKTIIIDALSLILGKRLPRGSNFVIRENESSATLIAKFKLTARLKVILTQAGIDCPDNIVIIRRSISADKTSKFWVNDISVSLTILDKIGQELCEIVGQNSSLSLLKPETYQKMLDSYGSYNAVLSSVSLSYSKYVEKRKQYDLALDLAKSVEADLADISEKLRDLSDLGLEQDEFQILSSKRKSHSNSAKIITFISQIQSIYSDADQSNVIEAKLNSLKKTVSQYSNYLDPSACEELLEYLNQTTDNIHNFGMRIEDLSSELAVTPSELKRIEERYFEIKDRASKYKLLPENLEAEILNLEEKQSELQNSTSNLTALDAELKSLRASFEASVAELTKKREFAKVKLVKAIKSELKLLALDKADFDINFIRKDQKDWNGSGAEKVDFIFSANPGLALQSLNLQASGGELTRFMLALKLVLANKYDERIMVFDEIDSAVGGQTADLIGRRLHKLSEFQQVIVITHSPQVASFGDRHILLRKNQSANSTETSAQILTKDQTKEEIARMLSGEEITFEARAQAHKLLDDQ